MHLNCVHYLCLQRTWQELLTLYFQLQSIEASNNRTSSIVSEKKAHVFYFKLANKTVFPFPFTFKRFLVLFTLILTYSNVIIHLNYMLKLSASLVSVIYKC